MLSVWSKNTIFVVIVLALVMASGAHAASLKDTTVTGDLAVTGTITGDGEGITNITGSVSDLNVGFIPQALTSTTLADSTIYQDVNGNIGIGSSAPQAKLDVDGDVYFGNGNVGIGTAAPKASLHTVNNVQNAVSWYLENGASPTAPSGIRAYGESDGAGGIFSYGGAVSTFDGSNNPTNLTSDHSFRKAGIYRFYGGIGHMFGYSAAGTDQAINWVLTAAVNGNVGVGTYNPQAKLEVGTATAYLPGSDPSVLIDNNLYVDGTVYGTTFYGDGSLLTGIGSGFLSKTGDDTTAYRLTLGELTVGAFLYTDAVNHWGVVGDYSSTHFSGFADGSIFFLPKEEAIGANQSSYGINFVSYYESGDRAFREIPVYNYQTSQVDGETHSGLMIGLSGPDSARSKALLMMGKAGFDYEAVGGHPDFLGNEQGTYIGINDNEHVASFLDFQYAGYRQFAVDHQGKAIFGALVDDGYGSVSSYELGVRNYATFDSGESVEYPYGLLIDTAPSTSSTKALLMMGAAEDFDFVNTHTGFKGSGEGTYFGIYAYHHFSGNFVHFLSEVGDMFTVNYEGAVTAKSFSGSGAGLTSVPGTISGLTASYIPKASSATALSNSIIYSTTVNVGISSTTPRAKLEIQQGTAGPGFKVTKTVSGDHLIVTSTGNMGIGSAVPGSMLHVGAGTVLPNSIVSIFSNVNSYSQVNHQNRSSGNAASTDFVATADNGTDSTNYINMGINSSGYAGGVVGAVNDAYLYSMNTDNDIYIGAGSTGQNVVFFNGGTTMATSERMRITSTGNVGINSATPLAQLEIKKVTTGPAFKVTNSTSGDYLVITSTGSMGIGAASPLGTLHTVGSSTGSSWLGLFAENGIAVENSAVISATQNKAVSVQGDGAAYFLGRDVTNNIEFIMGTSTTGAAFSGAITAHDYYLRTDNETRVIIKKTTGNVGVGSLNPRGALDVNGTIYGTTFYGSGAGLTGVTASPAGSSTYVQYNNGGALGGSSGFVFDGTNVGIGSTVPAAKLDIAGDIGLVAAPASDLTASGTVAMMTVGEDVAFGNILYLKSDGKLWKSDADAAATMPAMAMALGTISADASGKVLLQGFVRDDSGWSWTVGGLVYASATAGAVTQTAPATAGQQVQIIGIATHADRLYFNPNYTLVEIQ